MNLLLTALLAIHAWAATPYRYIEIEGSINPGSSSFLLDSIRATEAAQAPGLIVRLNTPGGLLSATREIISGINGSSVPVVIYVAPGGARATSAGALIALSSHVSVMAPGTNLGAAHPVGSGGEEIKGPMGDKATNDTAALARAQAVLRGRNPEAAEKIVTKSDSFSPEEAVKSKVVDFEAADLDTLLKKLEGRKVSVENPRREITLEAGKASELVALEMNLRQKFLHLVADPNISALLIALGGLAIYAEISAGFSTIIPGLFGVFCLLLGFVSLQTIPINVGGALLFALGLGLLAAEAFVTSYGLLTLAALGALFVGGLFLVDPGSTDMRVSLGLLIPLVGGIGLVAGFVGYLFFRERKSLSAPTQDPVIGAMAKISTIEADGRTGTAYANGELWSFVSETPMHVGEEAEIASLQGMRIHLKRRN